MELEYYGLVRTVNCKIIDEDTDINLEIAEFYDEAGGIVERYHVTQQNFGDTVESEVFEDLDDAQAFFDKLVDEAV